MSSLLTARTLNNFKQKMETKHDALLILNGRGMNPKNGFNALAYWILKPILLTILIHNKND